MKPEDRIVFERPDGVELVLDNQGNESLYELVGRMGLTAPPLTYTEEQYGPSYREILAAEYNAREVSLPFVIRGSSRAERDSLLKTLAQQLLITGVSNNWGKLKIRSEDGQVYYLNNCICVSGLDEIETNYRLFSKFILKFMAGDPYWYELSTTEIEVASDDNFVVLSDLLYLSDTFYLSGSRSIFDFTFQNDGQTAYPVIEVTGAASTISIVNYTTGKEFAMADDFELEEGEKLLIDCRDMLRSILKINSDGIETDVTNQLKVGKTLVFPIAPGNNSFRAQYTDNTVHAGFKIELQRRYLSV